MIAILSDIHNNLHALEAVLADMPKVSAVWVLGDMVGGASPFPCQVLDKIMSLDVSTTAVLGNWEAWALRTRHNIQPEWRQAGDKVAAGIWTIDALQPHHWRFLESLETSRQIGNALIFHGTPEDTRGIVDSQKEAAKLATKHNAKWLLGGHTHKAQMYRIDSQRVVGVGSVGLNSDRIYGTACYVLLDDDKITFRHVSYDLDAAVAAIENSELYQLSPTYAQETIEWMCRDE